MNICSRGAFSVILNPMRFEFIGCHKHDPTEKKRRIFHVLVATTSWPGYCIIVVLMESPTYRGRQQTDPLVLFMTTLSYPYTVSD